MKQAITLLLLFTAFLGFSQNSYQPGYFVSNDGTTTNCLIRNIGWKDSPTEFDYKLTEAAETQKANIKNVKKFNVSGYEFRRFTTDIDRSGNDVSRMSIKEAPEFIRETLFLKVLVDGKATLLHYEDSNLVRYFVSTDDNATAQQLVYKQYESDGKVGYNNKFRGQLFDIMKDKLKDPERFKSIRYSKDPLVKLFLEYNGGSGQEVSNLSASQNKSVINFKITPGVNFTSLDAMRRDGAGQKFDFDGKAIFRIGAEIELQLPFNNNKWALFVDPNYSQYKNKGALKNYKWNADFKYLEVPAGVRHYMYLNENSKLFIDAMYVLALNVGTSQISYNYLSDGQQYANPFDVTKTSYAAIGAGFSYSRYSAEVRLNLNRGILHNYVLVKSEYSSVSFILGYKLF